VIQAAYHREARCQEELKRLKDVDAFMSRSVLIGNALNFRRLLHQAIKQTAQEEIPYIYNSVESMFHQYQQNTFMIPDLLAVDTLAIDLGVDPGSADQYLKAILKKSTSDSDKRVWDLLPIMYAAAFPTSSVWREAVFKSQVEAHLNNAHSLSRCIVDLIVTFVSLTSHTNNEVDIVLALQKFVEVSSVILLRMARAKDDKRGPVDFASVIIFMDKFMDDTQLLSFDLLEGSLPYALLRNMYKELYETKIPPGKAAGEQVIDTAGF